MDNLNRQFAVWCAREALSYVPEPDPRLLGALDVVERFANGQASEAERTIAEDQAFDVGRTVSTGCEKRGSDAQCTACGAAAAVWCTADVDPTFAALSAFALAGKVAERAGRMRAAANGQNPDIAALHEATRFAAAALMFQESLGAKN